MTSTFRTNIATITLPALPSSPHFTVINVHITLCLLCTRQPFYTYVCTRVARNDSVPMYPQSFNLGFSHPLTGSVVCVFLWLNLCAESELGIVDY